MLSTPQKNNKFPVLDICDLDDSLMDDNNMMNDDPKWFQKGHNGDQILIQYQYNTCQFMIVKKCLPRVGSHRDDLLLV